MIGLENYYWCFQKALPKNVCEDIIKVGNSVEKQKGVVQGEVDGEFKQADNVRKSHISWLDDPWIYDQINPYVHAANENANWNVDWNWSETMQFTNYGPGQFYSWHADDSNKPFGKNHHPNYQNKIRKISVTVNLSDPLSYTGGELELDFRNNKEGRNIVSIDEGREQGSIIVFPSFVTHQVREVRSGKRESLVVWNLGPPWK